jgi:uncharacterized protein (TIGR03067 family)
MKRFIIVAMLVAASGCSTLHKSDTAILQGTWQGKEIGGKTAGNCLLVVSENTAEFRDVNPNEWLKATFSLREDTNPKQIVFLTTACAYPPHIGITRYAIYRIEDGTVRLTASEPGDTKVPSDFSAAGTRQFEFRRQ